jgi:hypothetical protein
MSKLRLATQEEAALLSITTKEWIEDGPSGFMFGSTRQVAQLAVMEFLANEQGLTIYPAVLEAQENKDGES